MTQEAIVTKATEAIVTALCEGPSTARDLSQRIEDVSYANIRQILVRLTKAGVVTKVRRGLYGISGGSPPESNCDTGHAAQAGMVASSTQECDTGRASVVTPKPHTDTMAQIEQAIAAAWADFHAMDNPMDQRAWATLGCRH